MHCVDHTSSIPMKNHEKSIHTPSFRHLSTSILLSRTVWVFHDPRCLSLPHATVALTSIQQRFVVATFHLNRPRSRNGFILRASVGFHHCTFVNQSLTWLSNNGNYILVIFKYKYMYIIVYIYTNIYLQFLTWKAISGILGVSLLCRQNQLLLDTSHRSSSSDRSQLQGDARYLNCFVIWYK